MLQDLYPWLKNTYSRVADIHRQGRLPHALLLTGVNGIGKRRFADRLAKALLCEQAGADLSPCQQCPSCLLNQAGTHPDYLKIVPEEEGKAVLVDQIRELTSSLSLMSHRGGHMVAVLYPAEAMNANAANSLLKTLEEPTDNTLVVLLSARPAHLPATIRSRCQQLHLRSPDREVALNWLMEQQPDADSELLLDLAADAPLLAREMGEGNILEDRERRFTQLVDLRNGTADPVNIAQEWCKDTDLKMIAWLQGWLMDMIRIQQTGGRATVRNRDLEGGLQAMAGGMDITGLFNRLDRVTQALRYRSANINQQMMIEDLLIAWVAQDTGRKRTQGLSR